MVDCQATLKGELVNEIYINAANIPEYAVKIAAMAAIELTESILRQPGGREMLDAETERRKAARVANTKTGRS